MQETKISNLSILLLRMALSGIFIAAGINHLQEPAKIAKRMAATPNQELLLLLGPLETQAYISGLLLLLFGSLFLFGIVTKWSAIALLILLIGITLSILIYDGILFGPLWKNIAIMGGLVFFIINKNLPYQLFPKYNK